MVKLANQQRLALGRALSFFEVCLGLVLPPPASLGEANSRDQHGGMERPLQKANVAQSLGQTRIRLGTAQRQEDDGKVGPGRLPCDPIRQNLPVLEEAPLR